MTSETATAPAPTLFDRQHRAITVGVVSVMTLFAFESMGVATAMPVVAESLHGLGSYSWAFSGYVMASLVAMVLAGTWCDVSGPGRPVLAGVAVFATGAAICGLAWSMPVLVFGRLVEGLGGGIGVVALYVVLGRAYEDQLRPKAFGLLSAAWVLPAIVGPFVAGLLVEHVSWRAVFFVVVPFVIPPTLLLLPRLARFGGGTGVESVDHRRERGRIGLALLVAGGLALIQEAGLRLGRAGAALGAAGLALLVPSLSRLLPDGTLRARRGLPTVILLRGLVAGAYFGAESFIPLALQSQRGLDPFHAGLALTAGALGWAAGAQVQGRRQQWGPIRLLQLGTGASTVGLATAPLCLIGSLNPYIAIVSWMIGAFGMGITFATLGNQTLTLAEPEEQGWASAALQISDAAGSTLLVGIAGAIYALALATGPVDATPFVTIWLLMATATLLACVLASRITRRSR